MHTSNNVMNLCVDYGLSEVLQFIKIINQREKTPIEKCVCSAMFLLLNSGFEITLYLI